ncbi:MFS transporter [Achromobacter sp. GG226]|uniref:MFS transporter n=1 Tax=Verticiella alkaliphila TaxID=2779529 RepID=UPI001C0BE081|nr:MFS transporter [Verticiella sp. GG226]MBU4611987.1 MFS transporter [Verticiella sp. GG226]
MTFFASALLGFAQVLIWGGSFFLLSVLAAPIHADTGWSLTGIYGALTLGVLVSAVLSPQASVYIARGHGRRVLVVSAWLVSIGLAMLAAAPNFGVFLLGWVVIGVGMAGGLYDPLFATLGTQLGGQARRAILAVTLIAGFATTITWPILAWLEHQLGWRLTCVVSGAVLAAAIGPLYWRALPPPAKPASAPVSESSPATRPAVRPADLGLEPAVYWLLTVVFSLAAILMTAVSVQIVVLLQGVGHDLTSAIALAALIGPSMVAMRLLNLALGDLDAVRMAVASTAAVAIGLLVISVAPAAAMVGIVAYGLGNGLRALVRGTLPLVMVPASSYALLMGKLARSSLFCQALTPLAGGFVLSQWGPGVTLWVLALLALMNAGLSVLLVQRIRRSRPQ